MVRELDASTADGSCATVRTNEEFKKWRASDLRWVV